MANNRLYIQDANGERLMVAARVDRLRCIGNGQVPAAHNLAWRILSEGLI